MQATDYELALMSQGTYQLSSDKNFNPPGDWYVIHKYFPICSWDFGIVIYEKIMDITSDYDGCGQPTIESNEPDKGKLVNSVSVEWVVAFRGTEPQSIWNWITNFGLFFNQKPMHALIDLRTVIGRRDMERIILKSLTDELEKEEDNLLIWPLYMKDIENYPVKHKQKLIDLLSQNRVLRRKIWQMTFTGHSFGFCRGTPKNA